MRLYPDKQAVVFQGEILSYSQLYEKAGRVSCLLQRRGVQKGDRVAVAFDRSLDLVASILGILMAGAVYVPIDPSYPPERAAFMLRDAGPKAVLTSPGYASHFPHSQVLFLSEIDLFSSPSLPELHPDDAAYICYTSGSTGAPKGVEVCHRGVVRLAASPLWMPIVPEDRFLFLSNISFDASVFDLFGALLNGASLSIFPQQKFSADALRETLDKERITRLFCTPKLFASLVDADPLIFRPLRLLSVGGDVMPALQAKQLKKALPSLRLFNEYGPTENTCITTVYEITDPDSIGADVPIGKPIDGTTVYLLDENLQPVSEGEIYTGGLGVAKGYLNNPEATVEKFIPNPFGSGKLYRTGDLGRLLPDGNIAFLGRRDDQLKIRGFRIEPGEIEHVLRQHGAVSDCLVMAREDASGEKILTAYLEGSEIGSIRSFAASALPEYMIPKFFVWLERFPLNPNGKVDRQALPCPKSSLASRAFQAPLSEKEKLAASVWERVLGLPRIGREDHFFHLGGDSIQSVQLSSEMGKALGREVPIHWIFEHASLEQYARRLDEEIRPAPICWEKEILLDPSILPESPAPHRAQFERPEKIFLTGATGFVGAFFLRELLEKTNAVIYCHIRGEPGRIESVLSSYLIWKPEYAARIVEAPGDLSQPLLGLKPSVFETLAAEIDSVFHIGALVNHALPYEAIKGANVSGTQEALRLAAKKKLKPFHYISTVDVLNPATPYAYSKWAGERLVHKAQERGVPASIYRLSRVVGDTETGAGPSNDFLWRMIQVCQRIHLYPRIDYREEMTPVDFVCRAIHYLSQSPRFMNREYPVFDSRFTSYADIFRLLASETADAEIWRSRLISSAQDSGDPALQALSSLFSEKGLEAPNAPLPNGVLLEALNGSGLSFPRIDEPLLRKYLAYFSKIGFLKAS